MIDCNGKNLAIRFDSTKFISVLTEPYMQMQKTLYAEPYMQKKQSCEKDQNSDTIKNIYR